MARVPNGIYSIDLPYGAGSITDAGEGRFLTILPVGALGPTKHQVCLKMSAPAYYSQILKDIDQIRDH